MSGGQTDKMEFVKQNMSTYSNFKFVLYKQDT